jgi:hypothetical protein
LWHTAGYIQTTQIEDGTLPEPTLRLTPEIVKCTALGVRIGQARIMITATIERWGVIAMAGWGGWHGKAEPE